MARIKIELTDEHIRLISNFYIQKLNKLNVKSGKEDWSDRFYGIDTYDLYKGTYWYQDMAEILGINNQVIEGTEEDFDGPKYPNNIVNKLREMDTFFIENLLNIEEIVHQFVIKGGLKPGIYTCKDNEHIWSWKEK